jgi:hypothetical protein
MEEFKKKSGSNDLDSFDESTMLGKTKELGMFVSLGRRETKKKIIT